MKILLLSLALLLPSASALALELNATKQFPESVTTGWIRSQVKPSTWPPTDAEIQAAMAKTPALKEEPVAFSLWLPAGLENQAVRGIVAISGHGSGEALYSRPDLRAVAAELRLALFRFTGNPMQRGFWPATLLNDQLREFGAQCQHPELVNAPIFCYGHSNATGFSGTFPATESARVWAWVSMRPGAPKYQILPGAAQVPGMVMYGEKDEGYFQKPSPRENLAIVENARKDHQALWHAVVEANGGHGPNDKSWTLVLSFLRNTFAARVPDADPRHGPVALNALKAESGFLGKNWDEAKGGAQTLTVSPYAEFTGDKTTASWLLNAAYAADWVAFQRDGVVK